MNALGRGGLTVGPLAFGSAPIGNLGREVSEDEWRGALSAAWNAGVRYFDTAPHYGLGLAERRLAAGLAEHDGFIVSTKVGRLLAPGPGDDMDDEGYAVPTTHVRVRDYSRDGIRVNCVNPGTADTPWVGRLLAQADDPAAERAALEARQPIGRLVSAQEVAAAICYLASPDAASTTGTVLAVDGGMHGLRPRR